MRWIDIIARASRSLRSAKLRTLLTSLAIAVGGFTLTLTLGAGTGANKYAETLIESNFDPSELLIAKDKQLFSNNQSPAPQEYDDTIASISGGGGNSSFQIKRLTPEDVADIKTVEGIEQVRENYQVGIQYVAKADGDKRFVGSIQTYNPAQKPELKYGTLPETGDIAEGEVLLPSVYIESLGFVSPEDSIGRTIIVSVQRPFSIGTAQALINQAQSTGADVTSSLSSLTEQTYDSKLVNLKVVGITKKSATSFEFGTAPLLVSNKDAKSLSDYTTEGTPNYERYTVVYARVKDGTDVSKRRAAQEILQQKGYNVQSVEETQKLLTQIVTILQTIVLVFGVITLIASVFGVINTQYISVLERTREIGLMKALGMRKKDINRLFILEATWIGLIGGTLGSLLGLLVGTIMNPYITDKLDLGVGNNLIIFNWTQVVGLIIILMLITTFAGILPAQKAAKLNPIDALRTE